MSGPAADNVHDVIEIGTGPIGQTLAGQVSKSV